MMPPSKSRWVLLAAFLSVSVPAHADDQQGQRECAALRSTVLQLVGDWSKNMLFASRDMDRDGWLDANVAHAAFKEVQIAVMHFDYAYEAVPKTRDACHELAFQFGMEVGTYIEEIMATGTRPHRGMQGREPARAVRLVRKLPAPPLGIVGSREEPKIF